jgi:hypothetical protein
MIQNGDRLVYQQFISNFLINESCAVDRIPPSLHHLKCRHRIRDQYYSIHIPSRILISYNAIPSFLSQVFSTCCLIAFNGFALNSGCCITALNRAISFSISFPFGRILISIFLDRFSRSSAMISSKDEFSESKFRVVFLGRFRIRFLDFFSWISGC